MVSQHAILILILLLAIAVVILASALAWYVGKVHEKLKRIELHLENSEQGQSDNAQPLPFQPLP